MRIISKFVCSGSTWGCTFGGHGTLTKNRTILKKMEVLYKNKIFLTENDKPGSIAVGICSALSGAPCVPKILPFTSWKNVSKNLHCNNAKALLSCSHIICANGGTIKIIYSGCKIDNIWIKLLCNAPKKNSSQKSFSFNHKNPLPHKENRPTIRSGKTPEIQTIVSVSHQDQPTTPPMSPATPELFRKKHWCSGECPDEYRVSCKFRNTPSQLRYKNKGSILKTNLQEEHNSFYEMVVNIIRTQTFSISHHHLIPGNQCYCKKEGENLRYELLVKLGYFFNYNINRSKNGIVLPTVISTPKSTDANDYTTTKILHYYTVMENDLQNNPQLLGFSEKEQEIIGSQLHQGPHKYENNLYTLRKICPEAHKLRSYESIVIAKLDSLNNFYMDMYENICFMKDYEKNKKEFFNHMDTISKQLQKGIRQFPHKNHEFSYLNKRIYVSFPAILFDLNIDPKECQESFPMLNKMIGSNTNQLLKKKFQKTMEGKKCINIISSPPKIRSVQIISTSTKRLYHSV